MRIIESDRTECDGANGFTDNLARIQGRDDTAAKLSVAAPDFYVHRIERISGGYGSG
ncbi:hypothetical protein IVB30_08690 [Bradyrhizobium sp. 200]|uniref:hypothetical protein n=1 Tax=Bradyrhizobium sp. 200 TaxID=2782665 RepID=UPI001FFFADC1|nr:hypothetical protein [Bradyrhizobium sp. 200]UPJ51409.1 hypothetical protein IVB30_08690 [Bradyrhizobium sp. 200]